MGGDLTRKAQGAAFSLVEVMVTAAILSGALLVVLGSLHTSRRSATVSRRQVVARTLLANLCDRYRLQDPRRLLEMFSDPAFGAEVLREDPVLNAAPWTTESVEKKGYVRSVFFGAVRGKPWLGVLQCSVRYRGLGQRWIEVSRRHFVPIVEGSAATIAQRAVPSGPGPAGRRRPSPGRTGRDGEGSASSGGASGAPPAASGEGDLAGVGRRWVELLAARDRVDGSEDVPWEAAQAPAAGAQARASTLAALGQFLGGQSTIPDGVYRYDHEPLEGDDGFGEGRLWVLRGRGKRVHLMLVSRFRVDPLSGRFVGRREAGGQPVRFLSGQPLRLYGPRRCRTDGGGWALMTATPRRLVLLRPASGGGSEAGQEVVLATVDVGWSASTAAAWRQRLDALASAQGVDPRPGARGAPTSEALAVRFGLE